MPTHQSKRLWQNSAQRISRREALGILGAFSALAFIGCGSDISWPGTSSESAACVLTPNITEGPYFVDEKLNRSDLTANTNDTNVTNGVPLNFDLTVLNYTSSGCSPLVGAQVDVWQADAGGIYSDEQVENTEGQTYLRGYQLTDSNGVVSFKTIFPGWYPSRTVHIHVMVRTFSDASNQTFAFTTQLFFDDTVTDSILALAPYNARGIRDTTNATDSLYSSETQLILTAASSGLDYTTAYTIGVQAS